jgi:peptide/nickel transport system substrate-binding protein
VAAWELLTQVENIDNTATAQDVADQLGAFGITIDVRRVPYDQMSDMLDGGRFQLAIGMWGAPDGWRPYFGLDQSVLQYVPPLTRGPGAGFALQQQTRDFGTVDLRKTIDATSLGVDVARQRALVRKMALVFNELLPILPLWERQGNNPIVAGARVAGWPKPDDPIYLNSPYADSFVIMMLLTGRLHPPA